MRVSEGGGLVSEVGSKMFILSEILHDGGSKRFLDWRMECVGIIVLIKYIRNKKYLPIFKKKTFAATSKRRYYIFINVSYSCNNNNKPLMCREK